MAYDASMGAASSAYGMGLSYLESAKGIYLQLFLFVLSFNIFLPFSVFRNLILRYFYVVDTVASTVDSTKKTAQSTLETGKAYVDSAKGKCNIMLKLKLQCLALNVS